MTKLKRSKSCITVEGREGGKENRRVTGEPNFGPGRGERDRQENRHRKGVLVVPQNFSAQRSCYSLAPRVPLSLPRARGAQPLPTTLPRVCSCSFSLRLPRPTPLTADARGLQPESGPAPGLPDSGVCSLCFSTPCPSPAVLGPPIPSGISRTRLRGEGFGCRPE